MSTQPLTFQQYQALPANQRRRFLRPDEYDKLTAEQRVQLGLEPDRQGAPIDFGGKVLPNPNGIQPMEDTQSPVPVTQLPEGASFNRQNYMGGAQMDASNPVPAEVIPPQMQTIAAKSSGQPQGDWFDANAPKGAAPQESDWFEQNNPKQAAPTQPASLGKDVFGDIPSNIVTRIGHQIKQNLDIPAQLGNAAKAISEGIKNIKEGGPSKMPEFIEALKQYKDPEKLAADLITGYITAGAPELPTIGAAKPPAWWRNPEAAAGAEGTASKALPTALKVGKMIPGVSHYAHLADFARKLIESASEKPAAEAPAPTAAPQAAAGPPELWGQRIPDLAPRVEPVTAAPATETPAAVASKPAAPPAATPKAVEQQLNDALGGKPLERNVPLKNQAAVTKEAPKLPEGFTPADSTALKGYKYDPAAKELETVTATGQRYVHGDVTPEQFQKFEAAESKGKAWNEIRQGSSPLVAKYINGKRTAVRPTTGGTAVDAAPAMPNALEKARAARVATPVQDLMQQLKQSLDDLDGGAKPSSGYSVDKIISNGVTYEHRYGSFYKNGQLLESGADIADAVDALESQPHQKVIEGEVLPPKLPPANSLEQARAARAAKSAPQFVYRARDIGEEGVPLNNQHAQATSDLGQAQQYAEAGQRGANAGEVVKIDLSKLKPSDYVVKTHPNGMKWIQFKRALTESEVSRIEGSGK